MGTVTVTVTDKSGHTATDSETYSVASPSSTIFGAFPGPDSTTDSSSYATRLARVTSLFGGKIGVQRNYQGGSLTLPTLQNPSIVSWDFPVASTLSGANDAAIDAIARNATKKVWVVPWHEVDYNKLSTTDYINVFRYVANRVHAVNNPLVRMATILAGYNTRGNGGTGNTPNLATFNSYYPGDAYVDCIGFDAYINPGVPGMATPELAFSGPLLAASQHGKPLLVGETSLFPGYTDAQWTDYVGRIIDLLDGPAEVVAWFEACKTDGDWRMSQHPNSVPLWSAVTTR